ncbi:MAG TPA: redoxin family protein [Segetibacter sp.]|jgi:thiol-disulfide isomerase/thioredoxin
MKNFILFFILMIVAGKSFSQTDTLAPFQQFPFIPPFKIQLTDSTWFSKSALSNKKPTWVIYFSPDCGHCQQETEEILSNIKSLKNLQIVMIASRPFEDVKNFYDYYLIRRYPNIKMGIDAARMVTNFYKVERTPFSALYDKKGDLIKAFKVAPELSEIIALAK